MFMASERSLNPPPVTIVMATYNGARHLPAQLASFAAQSHQNWQLFVSDDGSRDDTRDLILEFGRRHPVRLVDGPGKGAAANFLSALCHPDLPPGPVALSDQDDVWLKGKLARGLRRMADLPGQNRAILYSAESLLGDENQRLLKRSRSGQVRPAFAPSLGQNLFAGHAMILNGPALAVVRAAGMPAGVHWHDWWLYQLLAGSGAKLVLDPLPTVVYRQHGNNMIGGASGLSGARRRLQMLAGGEWGRMIRDHAVALQSQQDLLTRKAREELEAFLSAPPRGPARVRHLHRLGVRRSSAGGDLIMSLAAFLGRV